jgi:fibro-slime domain-containing protein
MFDRITKRIVSILAATVLTMSNVTSVYAVGYVPEQESSDLTHQKIELYPDEESDEKTVTLEGLMPEEAEASAVDVSDEHEGIAAYDITITDGGNEYQPGEDNPIRVEIVDHVITENIALWHIHDDGTREQIVDLLAEDGKVSFYATGFSVYEIVEPIQEVNVAYDVVPVSGESTYGVYNIDPVPAGSSFVYNVNKKLYPGVANKITSLAELKAHASDGIYIKSNKDNMYAKASSKKVDANRQGIAVTSAKNNSDETMNTISAYSDGAAKYYFAEVDPDDPDNTLYYIYTYTDANDPSSIKYVVQNSTNSLILVNNLDAVTGDQTAEWEFNYFGETVSIKAVRAEESYFWTSKGSSGLAAYKNPSATNGELFTLWIYEPLPEEITSDPYHLEEAPYGLINYNSATVGNAMIAAVPTGSSNTLGNLQYMTPGERNYSSAYGITGWQFEWVSGTDYRISAVAVDGNVRKYLKLDSDGVYLVDKTNASVLTVVPNNTGKIKISLPSANTAVFRDGNNSFKKGTNTNDANRYFDLVDLSSASADELGLNNQSYGIVYYASGATGYAMTSAATDDKQTKLTKQNVSAAVNSSGDREYIYFGDITSWTFENVDTNRYVIFTSTNDGIKYLKVINGSVSLSDTPYILTAVTGTDNYKGKIAIINAADKKSLRYSSNFENNSIDFSKADRFFDLVIPTSPAPTNDSLGLDGKTYGLVAYINDDDGCAVNPAVSSNKLTGTSVIYESGQYVTHTSLLSGWTFHWNGANKYTLSNPSGRFIKLSGNNIQLTDSDSEATPFSVVTDGGKLVFYDASASKVIALNGTLFQGADSNTSYPVQFDLVKIPETFIDIYGLDGQTFGLMYYAGGNSTTGYGMMVEQNNSTSLKAHQLMVRNNTVDLNGKLYVDLNSDITMWTFIGVSEDMYKLKADNGKYLKLTADGLTTADSESDASIFKVGRGTGNDSKKIKLECNGNYVRLNSSVFQKGTSGTLLNFVEKSDLTENDFVVYSATKVGVSDKETVTVTDEKTGETTEKEEYVVRDDSQIIVYTRAWNENEKKYEFYAIDHLGRLLPCYESGDSIMWIGNQINSLLWDFTEYHNADGTLNGYYELYNPYSRKYLAPLTNNRITSNGTVGINLRGRRNDEYYTRIVAWDEGDYAYYALDADVDLGRLISCKETSLEQNDESTDFYFAIMEPLKPDDISNDSLTPVETIDNTQYGITMSAINFENKINENDHTTKQDIYLGDNTVWGDHKYKPKQNILSTDLKTNGYPTATNGGHSLSELFEGARNVNHLFIKSTYEASGYFEFDSCQNYATLLDPATNSVTDNFTVYKELGTMNGSAKPTLRHGQFMPYNTIKAGGFIENLNDAKNPYNLYDALGNELKEDDPRKNEKLYYVKDPDYYHGMELSAGFVQTPNGHDAWGHDIIFEFTGDDDFWLYVDGELVIDLGGIHSALEGKVNFATGEVKVNSGTGDNVVKTTSLYELFRENYIGRKHTEAQALAYMQSQQNDTTLTLETIQENEDLYAVYNAYLSANNTEAEATSYLNDIFEPKTIGDETHYVFKDYTSHTMRIFYMERGAGASNLHMRFNLSYVTPGSVLMSKEVGGVDDLDYSLMKYPYQIYYQEVEDGPFERLRPNTENFGVYYLNPKRNATYYAQYKSLSNNQVYQDVYFLTPGKDVSISFPANTIKYYIVECGLNGEVYDAVQCNGGDSTVETNNGGKDFTIVAANVKERPNVQLVNKVDPDSVKTLTLRKKLVGQNGAEINDDNTTFSFRLYLEKTVTEEQEGVPTENKELELAYLRKYYVVSPDGKFCIWDSEQGKFVASSVDYNVDLEDKTPYTFETSPNGQISKIPVGYEVKVPGLLNGMKFKVEERESDNPIGYDVYSLEGYTCLKEGEIDSYFVESGESINTGTVRKGASPSMLITNKRGYGIEVKKVWSDADYTVSHEPVYIAVYVDGVLKEGTVRELNNNILSQRYFFDDDELYNGTKTLNDYHVREVTYDSETGMYKPIDQGKTTTINAVPTGGSATDYNYSVNYSEGEITGVVNNARKDTITNIREGGVTIRLFDWGGKTDPLANGTFLLTLTEDGEEPIEVGKGTYTTDSNGIVAILYSVSATGTYTLKEISSPRGYIGLPRSFSFTVTDAVTITDDNEAGWVDHSTTDESGTYKGIIDIHNKQLSLNARKIDSAANTGLPGAVFSLYRGVISGKGKIIQDYYPLTYYRCSNPECRQLSENPFEQPRRCSHCNGTEFTEETTFVSGENGVIPMITQNLPPDVYFLVEKRPPANHTGLPVSVIFQIDELGNIAIGNDVKVKKDGEEYTFSPKEDFAVDYAAQSDYLIRAGSNFTINIPNENGAHDYYFNIEKYAFLDKNVHYNDADTEQKFVFKVERFADDDPGCNSVLETTYVTLKCGTENSAHPELDTLSDFTGHSYDPAANMITVTYADGENYIFPASVVSGKQSVRLSSTGIYRVTEIAGWSVSDYDFWVGSNVYRGSGTVISQGKNAVKRKEPYVVFRVTDADIDRENCASVSFTNTETEFAYLSSQAYAENTISRSST